MPADPTVAFLDRLNDSSQWKIVRGVPIFKPHSRKVKTPDGKEHTITVTEADLPDIVHNMRRAKRESGVVPRISPGHIKLDPNCPEALQPEPWGWIPEYYVGTFGPSNKPAVLADFYFRPEFYEQAKAYPFRSAEYYPQSKEITGVALLKRDPQLDMGIVQYAGRDGCYLYAADGDADAGDAKAPAAAPTQPPTGQPPPTGKPVLSDDPVWQYMCQQYQQYMATLSPTNGALPGQAPAAPPQQMQRTGEVNQMSKQQEEVLRYLKLQNEQLAKRLDGIESKSREDQHNYAREKSRRVVDHLIYDGYQLPDPAKEVERMAGLSDAARLEREQEIRTCYQRAPTGRDYLPVREDTPPAQFARDPNEFTSAHLEKATQYMKDHPGCDWEDAKTFAMGPAK